jgi:predicted MPP superfamily phosphohydrolase
VAADALAAERTISRRDAIERIGGLAVLGTTSAVLGWGMVRGRHAFEINEVVVKIAGLPRVLDGYSIAQISDIHVGLFVGERELAEGLSRLAEAKPDLIVATGDLVDYDPRFIPMMAGSLGRLRARDGVVAILGNHDYYTSAEGVLAGLRAAGVKTLVNQTLHLRPEDGGGFALLGVDDITGSKAGGHGPSLARAIAAAPPDRARILLAHQPRFFKDAAGQVALQLSGHTHGGQVNPGFSPAGLFMDFVAGRYERLGSTLYVNRGFGVAGPPTRVGAPPEVTKIVLVSA